MFAIGFFVGGGVTLGFIDALGLNFGLFYWILAVVGGVVAALIFVRFMPWAFIIFASLVGSTLIVRGATVALLPSLVALVAVIAYPIPHVYQQHALSFLVYAQYAILFLDAVPYTSIRLPPPQDRLLILQGELR